MTYRFQEGPLISGRYMWGQRGLGIKAENLAFEGEHGAGYLANDVSLPSDNGKEVYGRVVTWPDEGELIPYEDGSFKYIGAPDGVHSFQYELFVDGISQGIATVTLTVGAFISVDSLHRYSWNVLQQTTTEITPQPENFSNTPGSTEIIGGRSKYPLWRQGVTPLAWMNVSGNTYDDIDPENDPIHNPDYPSPAIWRGNGGVQAMVDAWCGVAFDYVNSIIWNPLGGGHGDYAGNEVYKCDLMQDNPLWEMVRPPSGSKTLIDSEGIPVGATPIGNSYVLDDGQEVSGVYADGRPRAAHSYRKHVWTPSNGIVMVRQGGTYRAVGDSDKWTWTMDESTGEWTYRHTPTPVLRIGDSRGSAMYDSVNDRILWIGQANSGLWEINKSDYTWTRVGTSSKNSSSQCAFTYCKDLDLIFGYANAFTTTGFAVWDANADTITEITTTGTPPGFPIHGYNAYTWVPKLNAIAIYNGKSAFLGEVWLLTAPANPKTEPWVWSQLTTTGAPANSTAADSLPADTNGVFNQFGYSEYLDGFYFAGSYNAPINFLPLS